MVANLAEKQTNKAELFTDGEFTRKCMERMADIVCTDLKKKRFLYIYIYISFYNHFVVAGQIEETGTSVEIILEM